MNITKENLKSEFENYKMALKDDEMRQKVQEAIEISEFYGEDADITRAVDAICEMVNRYIYINDGKTPEPQKPAADDKAKRLRLARAKAKASLSLLELMKLDGIGGVTTAAPRKTAGVQGQLFDDVREHFAKHWDAERGEYVYTDFDGDQWYKNKKGHFCLLNGATGKTRKDYEEYLNEVGESLSEDEFIIGGKMRRMPYGKALRKYSPTTFNAGYNEWKQGLGGVNGNSDSEQHAIDVIKKRYPKKDVGEIKEFVGNHWGEWPSDISDDEIVELFEDWYFGDDINVLYDRFPDNEAEIQEYYNELHAWDWNKPRYDNLKAFKVWLDDRTNNVKEGGDLFESYWAYYGEKGTLTPLYNIDDLYGEDYGFAYQWLQEFLQADGYQIDRFWVNDDCDCYGFLAK